MRKRDDRICGWSICVSCLNNTGGCEWTEVIPGSNQIRFEPVPGWTAKKTTLPCWGKRVEAYHVTSCPKYQRNPAFDNAGERGEQIPKAVIGIGADGIKTAYRSALDAAAELGNRLKSCDITAMCIDTRWKAFGRFWRFAPKPETQPCVRCEKMYFCQKHLGCKNFKKWAKSAKKGVTK